MRRIGRAFCCAVAGVGIWLGGLDGAQAAGAMAVGACAAYGYGYDYREFGTARSAALRTCSGAQCKVVMLLKHSCAALAIDGHKPCGPHGYASARGLGQAENVALQSCYKYGGKDCVIRAWACDAKG